MSLSRRSFVRTLGLGGTGAMAASMIGGRAHAEPSIPAGETAPTVAQAMNRRYDAGFINLSSNTSPRGPGDAVLEALRSRIGPGLGRYPENVGMLRDAIAARLGVESENVLLSTGSGGELSGAVRAYVTPDRPLVIGAPSYETPEQTCRSLGLPVRSIPVDASQRLDLDAMASAGRGAGLVYLCNPNNPTAMAHSAAAIEDLVRRVKTASPSTAILVDEAYLEFAKDPSVGTAQPLALEYPGVFVLRTFSKVYALAALRIGYAVGLPATLETLDAAWGYGSITSMSAAAAIAALGDTERVRWEIAENHRVREFTLQAMRDMGLDVTDSQNNFVWANVGRTSKVFREQCLERGVLVGRDFAPMQDSHSRISLGSMDEMRRAVAVFTQVLAGSSA